MFLLLFLGTASIAFAKEAETAAAPPVQKIAVTRKEIRAGIAAGYDKTFYQSFAAGAAGALELNNIVQAETGVLFWKNADVFQANTFVKGGIVFPRWKHLALSAAYIFIALPEYEHYSHTLLPMLHLRFIPAGVSLGLSFRFSEFYRSIVFENILSFSIYVNFINRENFRFGFRFENCSDYATANFGSYWFNINSEFRITKVIKMALEIELAQSGSGGLSAAFYGVTFRPVLVITW
ncbi:MAG: hypothetical protein LBD20_06025 [Spirochaetaceae bacterium]|nr:hypothetical protein [Spirochaetaceae bacterium]